MREGAPPWTRAVREFATGKLAHYKIPRYVKIVDDFPMTVTGKVRKVEMRQQSTEELGLGWSRPLSRRCRWGADQVSGPRPRVEFDPARSCPDSP